MKGAELAVAVAQLCSATPELEKSLEAVLTKWVKDNVAKGATLESLRSYSKSGAGAVKWYIGQLTAKDAATLVKKFDPDRPKSPSETDLSLRAHLIGLVIEGHATYKKPPKRAEPMALKDVVAIHDSVMRRIELDRHKPAALKKAVKDLSIDADQLSSKASKTEIIEHIEAAIASGWPQVRSITDSNKLG